MVFISIKFVTMVYPYKKLIRSGFVAVPLLAISALLPVFFQPNPAIGTITKGLLAVTIIIFLLWVMNVLLVKAFEKSKRQLFRYITSVFLTFLIPFIMFSFFKPSDVVGGPPHPTIMPNQQHFEKHPRPHLVLNSRPFIPLFIVQMNNALILFIIALIILRENEKKVINENTQLKLMNLEAQQQQLKQQIHPHFLFNSLNTLKSLIKKHPEEAEEYLVKLSSFLRFNINSNTQNLIALEDEMRMCSDYLSIQKVRFKNALQYTIDLPKEIYSNVKVPVFAVQCLLENAIKHNVLTDSEPLKIEIRYLSDNRISIINNIQPKQVKDSSTGMGLSNLTERYKLMTDKSIEIIQTNNRFEVILPLL